MAEESDHEIAALKNALPGEGDPNAAGIAPSSDKMLSVQKNNENRTGSMLVIFYTFLGMGFLRFV